MRRISAGLLAGAVLLGCGGSSPGAGDVAPEPDRTRAPDARPLAEVFVLEATGAIPEDTTIVIPAGLGRVIELRRSGPDYGLFARLVVHRDSSKASAPLTLTLRPRPGLYALDVQVQGEMADSATIEFSYGMHFLAPAGAREKYGSEIEFERELWLGRIERDSQVVFLPTVRPGSDMVAAPLPGSGRYLVAAPR